MARRKLDTHTHTHTHTESDALVVFCIYGTGNDDDADSGTGATGCAPKTAEWLVATPSWTCSALLLGLAVAVSGVTRYYLYSFLFVV